MAKIFKNLRISYVVLIAALVLTEMEIVQFWQFTSVFIFFGLIGDVIEENMDIARKKKKLYKGVK